MIQQLQERTLHIKSDPLQIVAAESMIEDISKEIGLSNDQLGNILLCTVEGVRNAIEHGNQKDPSKMVLLKIEQHEGYLNVTVQDEGPGFDSSNIADPTAPENIEKPAGRGVFLIRSLADEVTFSDGGKKLVMKFLVG